MLQMALMLYQMPSCRSYFKISSIPRKNLVQTLIQNGRHHHATRCAANGEVLQSHSQSVAIYDQTIWSYDFIQSLETNFPMNCKEKVKKLEEKVMTMLTDYENGCFSTQQLLELVDDVERLGLGYRFQSYIKRVLDRVVVVDEIKEEDYLHVVSLKFRLLRQHGYSVSQDFLRRFKDDGGGFVGCLQTDVKALVSLYEASYLALEGELDLHEAKVFATENLSKLNCNDSEVMEDQINHALDVPLYRRINRLEARWYIDSYAKRKYANQHLLELAILDFNMVQLAHKRDLQKVSRWWENIGLAKKLSFIIRDRLMEFFLWSAGMVFEPQYSSCRVRITKVCTLLTTIDDIYDNAYGSLDELKVFTNAVKRWDVNAVENMPEYLQLGFLALYNTINEIAYDTLRTQGRNIIPLLAKVWGELSEAFLVEAEWTCSNDIPTFDDYLDNAWRSVSGVVILTHGYLTMNKEVNKDALESLEKYHDIFKWSSMIFRLYNDLAISSDEIARGKSANAISCYMNEHGACEEVAREYIKLLIEKAWMKMIEARVGYSFSDPFIEMTINLGRVSHCTYQYGDEIKAPDSRAKNRVLSMIIEPITIIEDEQGRSNYV